MRRCAVKLHILLLALIVVSGTLATYLFYQSHTFGSDLGVLEPQAREVIQNYDKNLPEYSEIRPGTRRLRTDAPGLPADFEEIRNSADAVRRSPIPRLSSNRRQPRAAVRTEIGLRRTTFPAIRAIHVRILVPPMDDQIPGVRNPGEGVGENENGILSGAVE